jgi:hypothetical protein
MYKIGMLVPIADFGVRTESVVNTSVPLYELRKALYTDGVCCKTAWEDNG